MSCFPLARQGRRGRASGFGAGRPTTVDPGRCRQANPPAPRVRPRDGAGASEVTVETDALEYVVWDEEYTEPMRIHLTSAAHGYLTLLSGGTGARLSILAPNDLLAQVPLRAGQALEFPLQQWRRLEVELRPQLPPGLDVNQQAIIAVVTRQPVALPPFDYEAGPDLAAARTIAVRSFQRWLGRIPPTQRGVAQAFYLVRRPCVTREER